MAQLGEHKYYFIGIALLIIGILALLANLGQDLSGWGYMVAILEISALRAADIRRCLPSIEPGRPKPFLKKAPWRTKPTHQKRI